MTNKLTRERIDQYANDPRMCNINDEIREMARMALAALDSEPVAEIRAYYPLGIDGGKQKFVQVTGELPDFGAQLYAIPQPVPERDQVRQEHAEWSQATFGNVGPIGPLKHLSKEALEAAAEPSDLSEWADMHFLLWDAQRRAGITDEQITQAMVEKLAVNKQREWPEPKDGEPRLHIKEQPAPVVPEKCPAEIRDLIASLSDALFNDDDAQEIWNTCRAAMLQAGNSPVIPDRWIPVSERMPEERETVVLVADERGIVWCAEIQDGEIYPDEFPGTRGFGCSEATHWMPLPAVPEVVKS